MSRRRSFVLRTVGSLALLGLLVLDGWLVVLNLAKHDRLPAVLEPVPGVEAAVARGADEAANAGGSAEPIGEVGAPATLLADDGPVPTLDEGDDAWPGGRGPVPAGGPVERRVLLDPDGSVRIVGSAPTWSVVTELVDVVARGLGRNRADVGIEVGWHPESSAGVAEVEVVLAAPLRYEVGQIELPTAGAEALAPAVQLLAERPGASGVIIGEVAGLDAGDEESAVALARVAAVVDELVAAGVARDRLVTVVAPAEIDGGDEAGAGVADQGDRVVVRLENLLLVPSAG